MLTVPRAKNQGQPAGPNISPQFLLMAQAYTQQQEQTKALLSGPDSKPSGEPEDKSGK